MSIVGIVAEYNPFHNGHFYHLDQSKSLTGAKHTIVVMSPNFVQRGQPAITDKWTRTKMALLSGADLVIELPTPYATASAEFFAQASVSLLHHTGIVDSLSFGSEKGKIDLLKEIAHILSKEPGHFKTLLKENLDQGLSFPRARAQALIDYSLFIPELSSLTREIKEIIQSPNNILGIEYLKALNKLNSSMRPLTLKRIGSAYHDQAIARPTPSATAIRRQVFKDNWQEIAPAMPKASYQLLQDQKKGSYSYPRSRDLSDFLCYRLLFSSPKDLQGIMGVSEGMENRIYKAFHQSQDIDEMVGLIKSKRFTQTAIQRILLSIVLQVTKKDFYAFEAGGGPQYIRVLGFKKSSAHLLAQMKDQASLPLLMNLRKDSQNLPPLGQKMLDLEIRSTNIYSALQKSRPNTNLDYTQPLVIL